jgi:hypothetical protein
MTAVLPTDDRVKAIMAAAMELGHVYAFVGDDTMPRYRQTLEDLVCKHLTPPAIAGTLELNGDSMSLTSADGKDLRNRAYDLYPQGSGPAALPAIPDDFHSHKDAWRRALKQCIANAPPATHDTDDAGYWKHELTAFDRAYAQLIFGPTVPTAAGFVAWVQAQPSDRPRVTIAEALAQYTKEIS